MCHRLSARVFGKTRERIQIFLPFQTRAQVRKSGKNALEKWEKQQEDSPSSAEELAVVLYWLRKLHPDFYKEVMDKMGISKEEIIKTIGGDILEKTREEGIEKGIEKGIEEGIEKGEIKSRQEDILGILDARFGNVSAELAEKVKSITDLKRLDQLIRLAATCENLEGFEKRM